MRSNRSKLRETAIGTIGSDNVFADLGLPADNRLLRSRLVAKIDEVIEKRSLTQADAGRIMGIPQPKVSELRNGRTNDYSVERLYRLLNNLGVGVSVVLEELPGWTKGEVAVREADPAT
jgi:predicted XRE-type DNA-binding protein